MGQKINPIGLRLGINRGWILLGLLRKKILVSFLSKILKLENILKKYNKLRCFRDYNRRGRLKNALYQFIPQDLVLSLEKKARI